MHTWIIEGLPPKVLQQHKKILGVTQNEEEWVEYENNPTNEDQVSDEKLDDSKDD